jgi:hypothetical protein
MLIPSWNHTHNLISSHLRVEMIVWRLIKRFRVLAGKDAKKNAFLPFSGGF